MKRKLVVFLLALVSCLALVFGLAACDLSSKPNDGDVTEQKNSVAGYAYVFSYVQIDCIDDSQKNEVENIKQAMENGLQGTTLTFLKDGTCSFGNQGNTQYGTYNQNEDIVSIIVNGATYEAKVSEKTITLTEEQDAYLINLVFIRGSGNITPEQPPVTTPPDENSGLIYELSSDGGYSVIAYKGSETKVIIPSTYEGLSVTSIGKYVFYKCSGLTSVTIPDSVTKIGTCSFAYCSSLTSIIVDKNNNYYKSIDGNLYNKDGTTLIQYAIGKTDTSFTIPNGVTAIGDNAFEGCFSLTSLTIPDGVTAIGMDAFIGCNSIEKATMPAIAISYISKTNLKEVTITSGEIGNYAFRGWSGLTSVTIGDSVTSIGEDAFKDCSSIENATMPAFAIDYIPTKSLQEVVITSGEIGSYAFSGCSGLTSVTIGNGVTSIGYSAFRYCSGLTSVTIPDSVTSIGSWAFEDCTSLNYNEYDNGYCLGNETNPYVVLVKAKDTSITSCSINAATKLIYNSAFYGCSGLTSIIIPDGVTSIGSSAFYDCSGLTSVTIGNDVTSIDSYAFYKCTNLTSVTIGNSVTWIGFSAFENCSSLTSITIPDGVTEIGSSAFDNCNKLEAIYITDLAAWCAISIVFSQSNIQWHAHNLYLNGTLVTDLVIPDGVTSIGSYAFYHCSGLTSITIPDSVTSIGSYAFEYCSGLTSVKIGNGVTSIGEWVFHGCSRLESVTIPNSVTSIGEYAFGECSGLTNVYYTGDIASWCGISGLGDLMYYGASGRKLYINGTEITGELIIPNGVTSIGSSAFYHCSGLTSITIPDSVTSIGSYAFYNCTSLTSIIVDENNNYYKSIDGNLYNKDGTTLIQYAIGKTDTSFTIPDGVTSIGNSAFYGCSGLTSITIPDSVTSIGNYAFEDCSGLTSISVNENNTAYASQDGILYNKEMTKFIHIPKAIKGSITIGDSVTSIGSYAFEGCSGLTSITIGDDVTSIGSYAFRGCSGLTDITFKGTKAQWNAITKGSSWNSGTGAYTIHCTDGDIAKS